MWDGYLGREAGTHRLRARKGGGTKNTVSYCRGRSWQTVRGGSGPCVRREKGEKGWMRIRSRVVTFSSAPRCTFTSTPMSLITNQWGTGDVEIGKGLGSDSCLI